MNNSTTIYRQNYSIIIKSDLHEACREDAKRVKYLCMAFMVPFSEYKSARKGDVLSREIMIQAKGYPGQLISFCEALRSLTSKMNTFVSTVSFTIQSTEPENARKLFE